VIPPLRVRRDILGYKMKVAKLEDVLLEKARAYMDKPRRRSKGQKELVERVVPENEKKYPEHSMFGQLPAYGLYIRHARNITLEGLQISYKLPEFRPALYCEDVDGLELIRNTLQSPADKSQSIIQID